ncbi:GNAT family N-acetyltransferase [Halocynthiibacter namhaensis]|uniref:GNAT family N-acetyltransferase n=1 Tax=Halocynthiibacter namhaensis TaxID=1290553 RepID=UPI001EE17BE9|nr:GNAT family N-acetyltransferase [Halocynthiibacter namhaensis]
MMTPQEMAQLHALCFETPRPWSAQEFADLQDMPGVIYEGTTTGFILGRVAGPEAELLTIAVTPTTRGVGLGRQLVQSYHAQAKAAGAIESFLEVAADNTPAISLYAGSGYIQAGKRPRYYRAQDGQTIDAFVFSCNLTT